MSERKDSFKLEGSFPIPHTHGDRIGKTLNQIIRRSQS